MDAHLSITVLAVDDVDATAAFYESVFGWPRGASVPGIWVELACSESHHLGLYRRSGFETQVGRPPAAAPAAGAISASELYVLVDDLDGAIARLRDAGAEELSERAERPWGAEAAYFRDPDGNVCAVATVLERGAGLGE